MWNLYIPPDHNEIVAVDKVLNGCHGCVFWETILMSEAHVQEFYYISVMVTWLINCHNLIVKELFTVHYFFTDQMGECAAAHYKHPQLGTWKV